MLFMNYKQTVGVILLALVLLVLPGCFGSKPDEGTYPDNDKTKIGDRTGTGQKEEDLVRCPLSGDKVPKEMVNRRPLAVMIENIPKARPQAGLDKADFIYEVLTEGAITRFLAVYLHGDADELGPVRSARPYYIERLLEYDAIFAYCGGSEAAKEMVRREGVASLDELEAAGRSAYWRVKRRSTPHNLYTSTKKLRDIGTKRGYEKSVVLPELLFLNPDEENPGGITSQILVINYPKSFSIVRWEYNFQGKVYSRYQGGAAHRDSVTGLQLTGANIIVQYVNTKIIDRMGRRDLSMIGRGRAILFTGGKSYSGIWLKSGTRTQTFFYGENGKVFKLNPGQTWVEVVPTETKVD